MVPARSHKVSRVSWYSGYRSVNLTFAYGAFTLYGRSSQNLSASLIESYMRSEPRSARTPVWALSISLAATLEIDFSFSSSGYLDVSVHRVPSVYLWIQYTVTEVSSAGFPHSDIHGLSLICSSPWLFAAYHVFLRLLVPRHPPCALLRLTFPFASSVTLLGVTFTFSSKGFFFLFLILLHHRNVSTGKLPALLSRTWPRMSCLSSRLQTFDTLRFLFRYSVFKVQTDCFFISH